jgi:hypothetical protein
MRPNKAEWRKLPISLSELCISTVLRCGQSFRYLAIEIVRGTHGMLTLRKMEDVGA